MTTRQVRCTCVATGKTVTRYVNPCVGCSQKLYVGASPALAVALDKAWPTVLLGRSVAELFRSGFGVLHTGGVLRMYMRDAVAARSAGYQIVEPILDGAGRIVGGKVGQVRPEARVTPATTAESLAAAARRAARYAMDEGVPLHAEHFDRAAWEKETVLSDDALLAAVAAHPGNTSFKDFALVAPDPVKAARAAKARAQYAIDTMARKCESGVYGYEVAAAAAAKAAAAERERRLEQERRRVEDLFNGIADAMASATAKAAAKDGWAPGDALPQFLAAMRYWDESMSKRQLKAFHRDGVRWLAKGYDWKAFMGDYEEDASENASVTVRVVKQRMLDAMTTICGLNGMTLSDGMHYCRFSAYVNTAFTINTTFKLVAREFWRAAMCYTLRQIDGRAAYYDPACSTLERVVDRFRIFESAGEDDGRAAGGAGAKRPRYDDGGDDGGGSDSDGGSGSGVD